jgi:glycerol-3-phosphate dehydrogenase
VPQPSRGSSEIASAGTFDRSESLRRLREETFDVLVVGGGVTGAGVALDAASRGLRTALVERGDFAAGTSSKSSKLVHGGIRYLAQREIRLVYESLHERQRLLDNAPHLVVPLPFLIPLFGRDGVVQKNVARAYSTALWLYDITGGWRIGRRHRRVGAPEALAHLPTLRTDRLVSGFFYYDAWADDARLTLEIARTAALEHGAVVANYTPVEALLRNGSGRVRGARVRPLSGPSWRSESPDTSKEPFEVRASAVVNATGVWADEVRSLEEPEHPHSLRPAKGVHVTLPRSKLPADIAAVIAVPKDRRSIFVVPWGDGDDVYAGTTDTAWDGALDEPACMPEDVDYILDALNHSVAQPVASDDVTGVWAGLRPLLAPKGQRHLSERTADLSRRHRVRSSESGLVTVTGGKLTTYRKMAEDTVDEVVRILATLGDPVAQHVRRCRTYRLPIRGAEGLARMLEPGAAKEHGLDEETFLALVHRHGGETPDVLALAEGRSDLLEPLVPGLPQLRVEALWAVRHEMALGIDDVLSRRTRATLRRAADAARGGRVDDALKPGDLGRDQGSIQVEAGAYAQKVLGDLERAGVPTGGTIAQRTAAAAHRGRANGSGIAAGDANRRSG